MNNQVPKVTAGILCDAPSCGALSSVKVLLSMGPLFFCGHHFNEKEFALKIQATLIDIIDERELASVGKLPPPPDSE